MSDRPIAFAGEGFEIVAHESPPVHYPAESHATVQICVPMFGARYGVKRESASGTSLDQTFGARDILLVPAWQPHAVHWFRHAGIVSLQLSEAFVLETLDAGHLTLPDFLAVQDRFVTTAATELYTSMTADESIAPVFAEALAVGVAHRVTTIAARRNGRRSSRARRLHPALLRRIERYIDDNLEHPVGLGELAVLAGLSRWYFLRAFREANGMSPSEYVVQRRLDRAQNLLRATTRSVMDIAAEVGMTHSHLSRVFSRKLGVTPTEFRRINRQ